MSVLSWILFGLIAGMIANFLDPTTDSGGILGALIGGFLANLVFGLEVTGFNFESLLIAILGSLLLLSIGRFLRSPT